jgi:hypothetical protein
LLSQSHQIERTGGQHNRHPSAEPSLSAADIAAAARTLITAER